MIRYSLRETVTGESPHVDKLISEAEVGEPLQSSFTSPTNCSTKLTFPSMSRWHPRTHSLHHFKTCFHHSRTIKQQLLSHFKTNFSGSFSAANQAEEWKTLYVRVLDFLETLDIDLDAPNQAKKGMEKNQNDVHR